MTQTLAWPVRIDASRRVATVAQGSLAAAMQSVDRITSVELGELGPVAPWLGLPALELRSALPEPEAIERAIEAQEPDADVQILRMPDPSVGEGWEAMQVQVALAGEGH